MSNEGLLLYPADTDFPASAYASWAATATAVTAAPTVALQANGWASDDLVRVDEINGAMVSTQDWMQFVYDTNSAPGGVGLRAEYFGSGVDGDVTISAPTTLTRDMFYGQLTIDSGGYINTAGYRIYARGGIDLSAADAGAIRFNGNNGSAPTAFLTALSGGVGGAAVVGNLASASGATGASCFYNGSSRWNTPALPVDPSMYFACYAELGVRSGGDGGGYRAGAIGANANANKVVGSYSNNNYRGEICHLPVVDLGAGALRSKRISGGLGGGGGGAGAMTTNTLGGGGAGGGGGASGGFIFIGARYITIDPAQPSGTIQAKGGAGGGGYTGDGGGGVGGGGGSGGTVVIVCEAVYLNTGDDLSQGVADVIDVSGGAGGSGSIGGAGGDCYAGCGGDGGNGGVVLIIRTGVDPDNTLGIERMTWAPSTAMGADGEQVNYGSTENVVKAGGAGGVWKVAL